MRMKSALLVIGACTIFLGLTNFSTSALQERVSTCETRLNNTQLQLINILEQMASNETKVAQQVISKQIEAATGVPGPTDQRMEDLFRRALELGQTAMRSTEAMQELLNEGCDEQRGLWFFISMIAVGVNSFIACLAFWLGLRVVDHSKREPPETGRQISEGREQAAGQGQPGRDHFGAAGRGMKSNLSASKVTVAWDSQGKAATVTVTPAGRSENGDD